MKLFSTCSLEIPKRLTIITTIVNPKIKILYFFVKDASSDVIIDFFVFWKLHDDTILPNLLLDLSLQSNPEHLQYQH